MSDPKERRGSVSATPAAGLPPIAVGLAVLLLIAGALATLLWTTVTGALAGLACFAMAGLVLATVLVRRWRQRR